MESVRWCAHERKPTNASAQSFVDVWLYQFLAMYYRVSHNSIITVHLSFAQGRHEHHRYLGKEREGALEAL